MSTQFYEDNIANEHVHTSGTTETHNARGSNSNDTNGTIISPTERLTELFAVTMTPTNINYSDYKQVLIAVSGGPANRYVLLPWIAPIMKDSPVCKRLTKLINRADIEAIHEKEGILADINNVWPASIRIMPVIILTSEPQEYFHSDSYIDTAEAFYDYILMADRYMLDIPYICTQFDKNLWLLAIREQQKLVWRANHSLLLPIEHKYLLRNRFTAAAGNFIHSPYPVTRPAMVVDPTITPIPTLGFLSPERFNQLISILLKSCTEEYVLKIIVILGSSLMYYSAVFTNADIIRAIPSKQVLACTMFYALRVMWVQELSMYRHNKCPAGKFILPLEAACALPSISTALQDSPYMILASTRGLCITGGLVLPAMYSGRRGLYDIKTFRERLHTYTRGCLKYIDWTAGGSATAVTGSCITACAVISPFEVWCDGLEDYFNEYYPSRQDKPVHSDRAINIANTPRCIIYENDDIPGVHSDTFSPSTPDTHTVNDQLHDDDLNDAGPEVCVFSDDELQDRIFQGSFVCMSTQTEHGRQVILPPNSHHESNNTTNTTESDPLVEPVIITRSDKANHQPTAEVIHDIDYSDIDLAVACPWEQFDTIAAMHFAAINSAACEMKPPRTLTMDYVKTENKHKYVVRGLHRDIDIFHVDDIAASVVRYHLDIVRAYYTGDTLHCFPSFISAANTGINTDIRWSSNRKDVRDIVLKYFQRGFGTLLNMNDRNSLLRYINSSNMWPAHRPTSIGMRSFKRFHKTPFFHRHIVEMFNPSFSRVGIHRALDTKRDRKPITKPNLNTLAYSTIISDVPMLRAACMHDTMGIRHVYTNEQLIAFI